MVSFLESKKVTLDITSRSIRLLLVKGKKVHKWASAPIQEAGLIEDGIITDPLYLGEKVRRLMITSDIRAKKIIASVNGIYSIFRLVILPVQNGHSQDEVLNNAAESILPISADNFYVSWKMLSPNGKGNKALLVGIQPNIIDPEIMALKSVGLKPSVMNVKGMALLKLVDKPFALIANIEYDYVDIVLVAEGLPYVMRTVARRYGITMVEWAKDITLLLEQTMMFYSSRNRTESSDLGIECYICGELADNQIMSGILEDACGHSLSSLSVPLEYPPNLPINQYMVNIGLAIRSTQIPQVQLEEQPVEVQGEDEIDGRE
jgi:type IV pilus assembly protein PilM